MSKILLLLAIALAFVTLSVAFSPAAKGGMYFAPPSNSCEQLYDCQKLGKSCAGTLNPFTGKSNCNASSANSTCCGLGLYCLNGTCKADNVGESCKKDSDCMGVGAPGPFVGCSNGSCAQLSLPGDECSTNEDCFFGSSTCVDSVCTGLGAGAQCTLNDTLKIARYACGPGLYCDNLKGKTTCQPQLAANATCTQTDVCADGNVCGAAAKKCIAPFQGGNGTKCGSSAECNTDSFCRATDSVCASWNSWTQTDCTNNSQCSDNQLCQCNQFTGEQFCMSLTHTVDTYCGSYLQSALSCLSTNNCSYFYSTTAGLSINTLPPNSCASQNCKSSYKKNAGCDCSSSKDMLGDCFYSEYCGGFPVWAIIVIAIVGVILVLVVIVVIVMVMRKRRTYDTIA